MRGLLHSWFWDNVGNSALPIARRLAAVAVPAWAIDSSASVPHLPVAIAILDTTLTSWPCMRICV